MVERIREFLAERPEGATSEDIAAQVLRLKGARGTVADRVVDAALAEDRQVARGGDGIWRLRSASRALKGAEFVSIGVRSSPPEDGPEQLVGLAAMRCSLGGQPRWFPEVQPIQQESALATRQSRSQTRASRWEETSSRPSTASL